MGPLIVGDYTISWGCVRFASRFLAIIWYVGNIVWNYFLGDFSSSDLAISVDMN